LHDIFVRLKSISYRVVSYVFFKLLVYIRPIRPYFVKISLHRHRHRCNPQYKRNRSLSDRAVHHLYFRYSNARGKHRPCRRGDFPPIYYRLFCTDSVKRLGIVINVCHHVPLQAYI